MRLTKIDQYKKFLNKDYLTSDQIRAGVRQPITEMQIGRRARELSTNAKPWALFDLDDTLTYKRPSLKALLPDFTRPVTIRSWAPWQKDLANDVIEPEMAAKFKELQDSGKFNMGILTARSERTRPVTERMMRANNLNPDLMMMRSIRGADENMSTGPLKAGLIDKYLGDAPIEMFFDDEEKNITALAGRVKTGIKVTPKILEEGSGMERQLASSVMSSRRFLSKKAVHAGLEAAKEITHRIVRI